VTRKNVETNGALGDRFVPRRLRTNARMDRLGLVAVRTRCSGPCERMARRAQLAVIPEHALRNQPRKADAPMNDTTIVYPTL
jgi:hypothetical protein